MLTRRPDIARDPFALTTEEMLRIWAGIGASSLLNANGQPVDATLVCNDQDEPVAIHLRRFFNTDYAECDDISACDQKDYEGLKRFFPIVNLKILPHNVRQLIDIVVQAAMDDPNVLPDLITYPYNIRANSDGDNHIDHEPQAVLFSGLNIHLTPVGRAKVTLGRIRCFSDLEKRKEAKADTTDTSERWRAFGAPFVSLTIEPGDVLIFRGGPKVARGLLPTAHEFETLGPEGSRLHDVFVPSAAPAHEIRPWRERLSSKYLRVAKTAIR